MTLCCCDSRRHCTSPHTVAEVKSALFKFFDTVSDSPVEATVTVSDDVAQWLQTWASERYAVTVGSGFVVAGKVRFVSHTQALKEAA